VLFVSTINGQGGVSVTTGTMAHPRGLITGASSGIGAVFADRLARDRYDLVIVARRRDRLEKLARQLQSKYSVRVEVMVADLTQPADLRSVEERVAGDTALELLINNAGFGAYMPFVALAPDRAEELIHLQVVAVTRLTRAALTGLIERGRGAIINVSSLLAFSGALPAPPLPKRATYAAAKAYVNTFTQILHSELQGTGVQVQALCTGRVRTEFHRIQGMDPDLFPADTVMTPEDVVDASLAGLRLGEVFCVPALNDPRLLLSIEEGQRRLLEQGLSGALAKRYVL
jgi:short-subunit dehydrogenase